MVREVSPTRAHTEEMLAACGADIEVDGLVVRLRPSALKPFELDVPGDPSQAAFWVVAACTVPGSDVTVDGVYLGPARTGFLDVLRRMGADVEVDRGRHDPGPIVRAARHGGAGDEIPGLDEIPVLAVAAAGPKGTTTFADVGELPVKETDRIATVASELSALGAARRGRRRSPGRARAGGAARRARCDSHGDHRIAMAMAVAALGADGETTIDGWDAVATSYPGVRS